MALGVVATDARARILAFVIQTRPLTRAVQVRDALRLAAGIRVTVIVGQTRASARAVLFFAIGIRAAGRRMTRLRNLVASGWFWVYNYFKLIYNITLGFLQATCESNTKFELKLEITKFGDVNEPPPTESLQ